MPNLNTAIAKSSSQVINNLPLSRPSNPRNPHLHLHY